MITFSDRQLRIPQMSRPVYLVTGGMSKFDRAIPEKRTEELGIEALTMAAGLIDKTPAEESRTTDRGVENDLHHRAAIQPIC